MNSQAASRSDLIRLQPRKSGNAQEIAASQECGRVQFGQVSIPLLDPRTLIEWRIGYRRWQEFDAVDGIGQDAAALRGNASHLVGVVADGVSQSFYGDIAAAKVTRFVIDSFWERRQDPPRENEFTAALKSFEDAVDREFVRPRHLPSGLYPMQREALEEIRESGSQAVFSAFILDVAARRLFLYQVGDVDAVVHLCGAKYKVVRAQSAGRWSSAGKSNLLLAAGDLDDVVGLVLRSDGMGESWGLSLNDAELNDEAFSALASEQAAKDDLSFVAFRFQPPPTSAQKVAETGKPTGGYQVREPASGGKRAPALPQSPAPSSGAATLPGRVKNAGIWRAGRRTLSTVFLWAFVTGLVTGCAIGWGIARGVYGKKPKSRKSLDVIVQEVPEFRFIDDMQSFGRAGAWVQIPQAGGVVSVTWPPNWHGSLQIRSAHGSAPGLSTSVRAPGDTQGTQSLLKIPVPAGPGDTVIRWYFLDINGNELRQGRFVLKAGRYYEILTELHGDS